MKLGFRSGWLPSTFPSKCRMHLSRNPSKVPRVHRLCRWESSNLFSQLPARGRTSPLLESVGNKSKPNTEKALHGGCSYFSEEYLQFRDEIISPVGQRPTVELQGGAEQRNAVSPFYVCFYPIYSWKCFQENTHGAHVFPHSRQRTASWL